jgi:hypothetical protein
MDKEREERLCTGYILITIGGGRCTKYKVINAK